MTEIIKYIVLISADAEWKVVSERFPGNEKYISPYGEWFINNIQADGVFDPKIIFFHGGWGKVAAAGSTQYVIDQWKPWLLVNLGTCGGLRGDVSRGEILLVEKTVIYDIYELMGDAEVHLKHYMTDIDLTWLSKPYPIDVHPSTLVSGDRDLLPADITGLMKKYHTYAGDWESGSIAWVASRNRTSVLILRGVTDLIDNSGGDAYDGKAEIFYDNTARVMNILLDSLSKWLLIYQAHLDVEAQKNK